MKNHHVFAPFVWSDTQIVSPYGHVHKNEHPSKTYVYRAFQRTENPHQYLFIPILQHLFTISVIMDVAHRLTCVWCKTIFTKPRVESEMKKILGTLALVGGLYGGAVAQADLSYAIASVEGYSRTEVVRLLLTSQYEGELLPLSDEASIDNYNKSKEASNTNNTSNSTAQVGDKPFYPDLATTKDPEKNYREIEVVNLNGMYLSDVVIGSVTNTLDKEKRYIEVSKEDKQNPLVMSTLTAIELSSIDRENTYTYSTTSNYTIGTSMGKFFIIADDNSYRYFDANRLGGNTKLVEELKKGKPITAQTFFYEAQENGLIDEHLTLKEFMNMTVEQHRALFVSGE